MISARDIVLSAWDHFRPPRSGSSCQPKWIAATNLPPIHPTESDAIYTQSDGTYISTDGRRPPTSRGGPIRPPCVPRPNPSADQTETAWRSTLEPATQLVHELRHALGLRPGVDRRIVRRAAHPDQPKPVPARPGIGLAAAQHHVPSGPPAPASASTRIVSASLRRFHRRPVAGSGSEMSR
ncbi:hypothetical protein Franean1_2341 [Parafrankia sp. EAN1pec]|nr:hypothetical protein Franean1_2341 [Frankia sp. EAN1pec]